MFDILRSDGHSLRVPSILVVDDEPRIRNGLSRFDWSTVGFTLLGSAWSGPAALDIIRTAGSPDVLLTDVRMPGMDGIELARTVRENHPDCDVVFLSGFSDLQYIQAAFELGAVQYLVKPVDQHELEKTLSAIAARNTGVTVRRSPAATTEEPPSPQLRYAATRSRQAVEIIHAEFAVPSLSLAAIAERLDAHPNYLSSCIHRDLGTTFSRYLESVRMEHARILLRDSSLAIHVIANRVGFRDARYFSVRFKNNTGMTPRAFRSAES